jgi:enediyne biosynthesis protein E2
MPTLLGTLRRILLAPKLRDVTFAGRGFQTEATEATARLEAIPQAVVIGFEWGIEAKDQWELERKLALVDIEQRGFAYEGAAMAFTVRDMMRGGKGPRTRELLLGELGHPHILLTYIGIGFAMARLPRPLWKNILPDLTGSPFYPTLNWLVVDGYGFDLAYFHTKKYVSQQKVPPPYPWRGYPDYFPRAVDQGIGRALWFINGARTADVTTAVEKFPAQRQADLWSGVGLASTFAGGSSPEQFQQLRRNAGEYQNELALGSVFAITGRLASGHVPPHSAEALKALTGLSTEDALIIAGTTAVDPEDTGPVPQYEVWRQKIRDHFTALWETEAAA